MQDDISSESQRGKHHLALKYERAPEDGSFSREYGLQLGSGLLSYLRETVLAGGRWGAHLQSSP